MVEFNFQFAVIGNKKLRFSHYPDRIDAAARYLSTMYDFKMSYDEAVRALS